MTAMGAASSDEDVAAVLTFVRNSFGNSAPPVSAEQVKALRGEIGKPMLTEADLIPVK
jgi:mono/diheme cytochrome c family protein